MSKDCISMLKSKKLPIKGKALKNLLIRSTGRNFLLLKQSSTIVNCACPQKVYRMHFTVLSIQLKTAKSTLKSSMKLITNLRLNGLLFQKRNSNKRLSSAMILWLQDQINSLSDT